MLWGVLLKSKKTNQKDARHLKNTKVFSHSKRFKKDIEKEGNEKWKVKERFYNENKILCFCFLCKDGDIFCSKT